MKAMDGNTLTWRETFYTSINIQFVLLVTAVIFSIHRYQISRRLPPGPWGIPILGNIPFINLNEPHKTFANWCKKYGNVISFYMGSVLVVVLGDYKSIKEAFVRQGFIFTGVPPNNPFDVKSTLRGLLLSEGEVAMRHRKFILTTLRDFGLGKSNLELQIMDEMKHFTSEIRKSNEQLIDLKDILAMSVANVIYLFQFGKRYDYSDEKLKYSIKVTNKLNTLGGAAASRIFLPWTKYIPFFEHISKLKTLRKIANEVEEYLKNEIQEVKDNYTEGNKRNYTESFLTERLSTVQQNGTEDEFNDAALAGNLILLYGAGTQTISHTILWCLLFLLKYPNVLKKVQKEIDDVIGHDREPCKPFLINVISPRHTFTEATILEVQRHVSVLTLSLPHSNMETTTLFGYRIPKRSYVIGNIYAVHHNKSLWGDPETFRPQRFLDDEGQIKKPEYFMPFSIGKRSCVGEPLAQVELFLYFTSILQQFNFNLPKDDTLSFDYEFGISLVPKPFKLSFTQR